MNSGCSPSHFSDIGMKRLLTQCNSCVSPPLCCILFQQILLSCGFPLLGVQLSSRHILFLEFSSLPVPLPSSVSTHTSWIHSCFLSAPSSDQFSYSPFTERRHQDKESSLTQKASVKWCMLHLEILVLCVKLTVLKKGEMFNELFLS